MPKPEFPHLEKYLEAQSKRIPDAGAATVGMACGFSSMFGALFQVVFGLKTGDWGVASLIWIPVVLIQAGVLIWYFKYRPRGIREETRLKMKAQNVVYRLNNLRNQRRLKAEMGQGVCELLDAGARYYLEAKQAFDSQFWAKGGPETVYSAARERALSAMDLAMARLLLTCSEAAVAGVDFLSPTLHPAETLVGEMREMARESVRLAGQISAGSHATSAISGTSELRDALADLRRVADAHEEVERSRERG